MTHEGGRGQAESSLKVSRQVALIAETHLSGDLLKNGARVHQQVLCAFYAESCEVLVRRKAGGLFELACEMKRTQVCHFGQLRQGERARIVGMDIVEDLPEVRFGEAFGPFAEAEPSARVFAEQMDGQQTGERFRVNSALDPVVPQFGSQGTNELTGEGIVLA